MFNNYPQGIIKLAVKDNEDLEIEYINSFALN